MKTKNSTVYVTKTIGPSHGAPSPDVEEDIIAIHKFETDPAVVGVDYGLTMNLGDYESAKIGVSVSVPCYKEELNEAYEFAQAWAEERLAKERDLIRSSRDGTSSPL